MRVTDLYDMGKGKDKRISLGPCPVPLYTYSAFTRMPRGVMEDLWRLVGPTVERNIDRPLWAQFCAAYYEGLNHGAGAERERLLGTGEYREPIPWLP